MILTRIALWLVAAFLLCAITLMPMRAMAAPASQFSPQSTAGDTTQSIDVVVLLDDSGSMATCWPWPRGAPPFAPPCGTPSPNLPSDPNALRYSAARLLLQLLDDEDRVAVVRFDSDAAGVGALGALQPIGSDENRRQLTASLQEPQSYFERGYTRIDLGLEQAIQLLDAAREPGRSQYVLLLTDGEPSEQANVQDQRPRIIEQLQALADDDVLVAPVVLCNPTAGCAGEFLRENLADAFDAGVQEAATAQDLLRIFSEILAGMKPDRSIISTRDATGALQLLTREAHGARQLTYVTPSGNLLSVKRDGAPVLPTAVLREPNIDVNIVSQEALTAGRWTANTFDRSGFVVVQADSYPQLINPPPSLANSPASTRYYPEGRPPLLVARAAGPGATEPLILADVGTFAPLGDSGDRVLLPAELPAEVRLQLGDDREPLQLERRFRIEPRADLPRAEIFAPVGQEPQLTNGRLPLQVGFGGGADVSDLAATVYVSDESADAGGGGRLVYQADMFCVDRLCSDANFAPEDGRSYQLTYLLQGQKDGIRFSDWTQTDLGLAPAVYLRGLPPQLDLAQMPADGWPIELSSGAVEPIGALGASITVYAAGSDEPLSGVTLDFNADVPEDGVTSTKLKIDGLESLRPGTYSGEILLSATTPNGRPMDVEIRPGSVLPVEFAVPRPLARLEETAVDFGSVQFETSPNFRLSQSAEIPLSFEGKPFEVSVALQGSSCAEIAVTAGELQQIEDRFVLPLTLTSDRPVQPDTCTGTLALSGPDGDFDVLPATVDWRTSIDAVEWSLAGSELNLGDLQDAGARVAGTILLRFNGQTPFVVQLESINASGETDAGVQALTVEELEMPPVEVVGEPNEAGLYKIPVSLIARSRIPHDPLRGTFYSGDLAISIAGLPQQVETAAISFRSPNLVQRYVMPVVGPIYSMPQALLTAPLTLLLLLIVVARVRGRNIDEAEIEEAAMAAAMQMKSTPEMAASTTASQPFVPVTASSAEQVWGTSEWGLPWQGSASEGQAPSSLSNTGGDPWETSW